MRGQYTQGWVLWGLLPQLSSQLPLFGMLFPCSVSCLFLSAPSPPGSCRDFHLTWAVFYLKTTKSSLSSLLSPFLNSFTNKSKTPKPLIPPLGRQRQRDQRFKATREFWVSLSYRKPCLQKKNKKESEIILPVSTLILGYLGELVPRSLK